MQPVAGSLDLLQGDKHVSVGYLLPTLYCVQHTLNNCKVFTNEGEIFLDSILLILNKRFGNVMKINNDNADLILGAVSHPKFKLKWLDGADQDFARKLFLDEHNKKRSIDSTHNNSQHDLTKNENSFFKNFLSTNASVNDSSLEAIKYLHDNSSAVISLKNFPVVMKMYLKYNTTLPSSGVVERLFSQALIVNTSRRNRLSDHTLNKVEYI